MAAYTEHLRRQFADRSLYWSARSCSRLKQLLPNGCQTIAIIGDGIDHSKFRFPRSECFQAKDLDAFVRPCMDMTALICHGHGVFCFPTIVPVAKDSNLMADLLSFVLHRVIESGRVDGRCVELLLQTDNTTREWKNNCLTRLLALYVSSHRLRRGELKCLMTGHSHEDVDQYFSILSNHIQTYKELHTPNHFKRCLEEFHNDGTVRPNEPLREVHLVSCARSWMLASMSVS